MITRDELLKAVTVKQEKITLETFDNKEITIRAMTINEADEIDEIRKKVIKGEATDKDLIIETCRKVMIEPSFFTDEELKNISQKGFTILTEIYMKVPTIGMTDEQKEDYRNNLIEQMQGKIKSILSKAELEKKQGKKKSSSSN